MKNKDFLDALDRIQGKPFSVTLTSNESPDAIHLEECRLEMGSNCSFIRLGASTCIYVQHNQAIRKNRKGNIVCEATANLGKNKGIADRYRLEIHL